MHTRRAVARRGGLRARGVRLPEVGFDRNAGRIAIEYHELFRTTPAKQRKQTADDLPKVIVPAHAPRYLAGCDAPESPALVVPGKCRAGDHQDASRNGSEHG